MARIRRCGVAAAITISLALPTAPAAVADARTEPKEAFSEIVDRFIDAAERGDATTIASLFTEDAILMRPGRAPPIQGKDNIRRFLDEYLKDKMHQNQKITPVELMIGSSKSMIGAGIWSSDVHDQKGLQMMHVEGTYLAAGIIVDGEWKIWSTAWQVETPNEASGSTTPSRVDTSTPTNK